MDKALEECGELWKLVEPFVNQGILGALCVLLGLALAFTLRHYLRDNREVRAELVEVNGVSAEALRSASSTTEEGLHAVEERMTRLELKLDELLRRPG